MTGAGGFQYDKTLFTSFTDGTKQLRDNVDGDRQAFDAGATAKVDFGQHATGFESAQKFFHLYAGARSAFLGNVKSFVAALDTLNTGASKISQKYQDGLMSDVDGVNGVDSVLNQPSS
jgi:hypothetical protein